MSDKPINDGGPAFPLTLKDNYELGHLYAQGVTGMSLRDYFAAKAMQGMLCHQASFENVEKTAQWAYEQADSMLKAREQ